MSDSSSTRPGDARPDPFDSMTCPKCGHRLRRVPRPVWARLAGLFVKTRRYQCVSCGWSGLQMKSRAAPPA